MNQIAETTHGGRIDKIARYGWSVSDTPGRMQHIHKARLHVDHAYQRNANTAKISAIAREWSWVALGAIIVADRGGQFYVIDGQHRVMAARMRSDIGDLPCVVFATSGLIEEADGFLRSNKNRRPMTSIETFRASLISGHETAVYLQGLFDRNGIEAVGSSNVFGVKCLSIMTRLADQKRQSLEAMFPVAVELARAEGTAVPERIIDALCYLHHNADGCDLAAPYWRARLVKIGQPALIKAAAEGAAFYARGGAAAWASGMLQAINKGLRNKFAIRSIDASN